MSLFSKDDRAGLYITVIFHLTVIIVLLLYSIDSTIRREESFVLDFSKQEEIERKEKEEVFKEDISRKLDEMIAAAQSSSAPIRNIAVDATNSRLKDDRGTDAEQLYKDAERLAKDLRNGGKDAIEEDAREETVEMQHTPEKSNSLPNWISPPGASLLQPANISRNVNKIRHAAILLIVILPFSKLYYLDIICQSFLQPSAMRLQMSGSIISGKDQ